MTTNVVRIRRKNGTIIQDCDVYIGRACYQGGWNLPSSPFANPFSTSKYGRDEAIKMYEKYIRNNPNLLKQLHTLKNKTLGCWCKPEPCHGDVLVKLINEI